MGPPLGNDENLTGRLGKDENPHWPQGGLDAVISPQNPHCEMVFRRTSVH
jgi:hypothetical protein